MLRRLLLAQRRRICLSHRVRQHFLSSNGNNGNAVATVPSSSLVNFQTSAKIEGDETQIATFTLQPHQTIRAETGSLIFMTEGVEMETSSSVSDAMKRFMTGQNLFVTDFTYRPTKERSSSSSGQVALGTAFPSKLLRLNLGDYPDNTIVCQKGAYVASNVGVGIEMAFTKSLQAGFFGGQGFVLQKLEGQGDVLLQAGGTLVRRDLDYGETLRVSSGSLVAMTSTVDYDVQTMPGFNNVVFGGEGLFVTTLTGPGTIWLQGMPPDRMVSEIARRVPRGGPGIALGGAGGAGGVGDATGEGDASAEEGEAEEEAPEDMVAATDVAVDADRQATVATSGAMTDDADSPSALFGDAGPTPSDDNDDSNDWKDPTATTQQEPTFQDDVFHNHDATGQQQNDEMSFSDDDFPTQQQEDDSDFFGEEKFGDDSSFSSFGEEGSDLFESATSDEAQSTATSVLTTIWDLFFRDD